MSLREKIQEEFKKIKENSDSSLYNNMLHGDYCPEDFKDLEVTLEQRFGGEGQGEEYFSVYKFTDGESEEYVKFDGWYASYNGAEYEDWFFVKPKEVIQTVYTRD